MTPPTQIAKDRWPSARACVPEGGAKAQSNLSCVRVVRVGVVLVLNDCCPMPPRESEGIPVFPIVCL
eukprot:7039449-Lingulodinium_polyedra.AAC.1